MSADKSGKVYQGVQVKNTVRELLQRLRAQEADSKKVKTISPACLDRQDPCASTLQSRYVDPPTAVLPADTSSCGARAQQLRSPSFPFDDGSCNIPMQESTFTYIQQQFGDMMLPSNGYSSSSNNNNNNNNGHNIAGSSSYAASLHPPASLPLPLCHGLSSDADYYGPGMAPCSSPESLKLYSPVDPNGYSPQDSFSSSSSSCYDSPTRMQSSFHSFPSEHFHYQHCNLQDCYCLPPCWPGQQESFSAPEYAPYYNPTDYPYACPVEDSYLKRDLQMSSEMCYNVL